MKEYTPYQEGIIRRYYKNRQVLAFQKLEELAADLYLADTERKRSSLWKRVEKAMSNLNVPPKVAGYILSTRDPEILARNLKDWWQSLPEKPKKKEPGSS